MPVYQVVIVEDEPMIRMLNRSYLEKDPRFHVAQEFGDGRAALHWLLNNPVDLVVLDVYMPGLTGLELLRELRAHGCRADAVMVTAANDAETLDQLLKLGVTDYLVKPFTCQRFQQALDKFCFNREALHGQGNVSQSEIDHLLFAASPAAPIPKGLQEKTLEKIRSCLSAEGRTSEEIAAQAGLSTVTARRYLNYMVESGDAKSQIHYDTGGRPCAVYQAAPAKGAK